jgi:uncharacterized protein
MTMMKKLILIASLSFLIISCMQPRKSDLAILVVAGGHGYDTLAFQQTFEGLQGMVTEFVMQPEANRMISAGETDDYDVIVFYDSWKQITEEEKQGYLQLLQNGTGLVFLHHALVSYQNWPEFTEIIGGKYQQPRFDGDTSDLSGYMHDIEMHVVTNANHPITRDVKDFDIFDEGYTNLLVLPTVNPLLTTEHEHCHPIIGWAHQVENSKVVYLLPGHAQPGLHNASYKQIILNSIRWSAGL